MAEFLAHKASDSGPFVFSSSEDCSGWIEGISNVFENARSVVLPESSIDCGVEMVAVRFPQIYVVLARSQKATNPRFFLSVMDSSGQARDRHDIVSFSYDDKHGCMNFFVADGERGEKLATRVYKSGLVEPSILA